MISFFFIVILPMLLVLGGGAFTLPGSPVRKYIDAKKENKRVAVLPQGKTRSWPAQQILKKNNTLPEEHKVDELERIVDALDVKYIIDDVNEHFHYWDSYSANAGYRWEHRCYGRCSMGKYKEIYEGLEEIADAISTQKHMVKVAAVADDLKRVDEIIARIKTEKNLISETTLAITTGF